MSNDVRAQRSRLDEQFLRQDCEQWTDSYWQNEALGEQRVTFYVTLVSAALAGLVALLTAEHFDVALVRPLGALALGVVLLVGGVTLLRIARRNRVKEEYLYRVRRIRRYFTGGAYDEFYCKLLNDERAWKRAGLAVLVSVMNGTVGGTLIALLLFPCGIPAAVVGATVVFCVGVWGQLKWVEVDEEKAKASIKENGGREPLSPWDDAS